MVSINPSTNQDLLADTPSNPRPPAKKKRIRPPATEARKTQMRAYMATWRLEHPEEAHKRNVALRAKHPEKFQAAMTRYCETHREILSERSAAYRAANPEKWAAIKAASLKAHPEVAHTYVKQRRALIKGAAINDFSQARVAAVRLPPVPPRLTVHFLLGLSGVCPAWILMAWVCFTAAAFVAWLPYFFPLSSTTTYFVPFFSVWTGIALLLAPYALISTSILPLATASRLLRMARLSLAGMTRCPLRPTPPSPPFTPPPDDGSK
jgi:hypothetical protein